MFRFHRPAPRGAALFTAPAIALAAVLISACVVTLGVLWLLVRGCRDRPILALTLVAVVPLLAALAFVVAISGFMFTPQLGWVLLACSLVALVLVPASLVVGL